MVAAAHHLVAERSIETLGGHRRVQLEVGQPALMGSSFEFSNQGSADPAPAPVGRDVTGSKFATLRHQGGKADDLAARFVDDPDLAIRLRRNRRTSWSVIGNGAQSSRTARG
jgi:hypothetical protein